MSDKSDVQVIKRREGKRNINRGNQGKKQEREFDEAEKKNKRISNHPVYQLQLKKEERLHREINSIPGYLRKLKDNEIKMRLQYKISQSVGQPPIGEISAKRRALSIRKQNLLDAISVEEKFTKLLRQSIEKNFIEIEETWNEKEASLKWYIEFYESALRTKELAKKFFSAQNNISEKRNLGIFFGENLGGGKWAYLEVPNEDDLRTAQAELNSLTKRRAQIYPTGDRLQRQLDKLNFNEYDSQNGNANIIMNNE